MGTPLLDRETEMVLFVIWLVIDMNNRSGNMSNSGGDIGNWGGDIGNWGGDMNRSGDIGSGAGDMGQFTPQNQYVEETYVEKGPGVNAKKKLEPKQRGVG
jgi:hypothetical protein